MRHGDRVRIEREQIRTAELFRVADAYQFIDNMPVAEVDTVKYTQRDGGRPGIPRGNFFE